MEKLYNRIDWHNNASPAINETNLNRMSKALDDIDDRVIAIGGDVLEVVPQIQSYLEQADDLVEALELMTANPPYIGANGHWYTWDTQTGAYTDSGIDASITVQISAITMLAPDATPYVENEGTDTDPIFHLYIPRGQTGAAGQDGVSPTVTISTITGGHRITITDEDHPDGQSFDVMDGQDGGVTSFNNRTGAVMPQSGDYTASDVGAVASNGGEAGDTIVTFTDPSQDGNITSGSALKTIIGLIKYKLSHITGGGHTILNGSGSAMTQRGKLQFVGLNVTDDSGNDKTVVTAPTPDYADAQYSSSTTYSKGMTCIEGNVRYRYKNSTATSGHQPPNATYWEVLSVADGLKKGTLLQEVTSTTFSDGFAKLYNIISNLSQAEVDRTYIEFARGAVYRFVKRDGTWYEYVSDWIYDSSTMYKAYAKIESSSSAKYLLFSFTTSGMSVLDRSNESYSVPVKLYY